MKKISIGGITFDPALIDVETLEPLLREFAGLIGVEATMQLVAAHRGRRLSVPKEARADHEYAQLLGLEKWAVLCKHYGGTEHFEIPMAHRALRAIRNAYIVTHREERSVSQWSKATGLSERTVWGILARGAEDSRQMDMFPPP